MPSPDEHLRVARRNRKLLDDGLFTADERWAVVIAFYTALHYVERLAAREGRTTIRTTTAPCGFPVTQTTM